MHARQSGFYLYKPTQRGQAITCKRAVSFELERDRDLGVLGFALSGSRPRSMSHTPIGGAQVDKNG